MKCSTPPDRTAATASPKPGTACKTWPAAVLCAILLSPPLCAQQQLLPVFHFRQVEGIFTGQIRSRVARDQEGFAWIGTLYGLERFDGHGIRSYRNEPGNPHSLPLGYTTALLVDRRNRLWVGTYGEGVCLYDRVNDRFFRIPLNPADSTMYRAKAVTALLEDRAGNVWVGSSTGYVLRIELPGGVPGAALDSLPATRFRAFPLQTPKGIAADLCETDDGEILIATDSGLKVLDPSTLVLTGSDAVTPDGSRLDTTWIRCVRRDSRGNIWVGTKAAGLVRLEAGTGRVSRFRHREGDPSSLTSDEILDVAEDITGDLWISTVAGLDLWSPTARSRRPFLTTGRSPDGPSWMRALTVDRTGCLWVGTIGGVTCLSPRSRAIPKFGLPAQGRSSPVTFETILRNGSGNRWLSSVGMLFQVDLASMTAPRSINVFHGKKPTYIDLATFADRNDVLWYGSWGLGLFRIDPRTGSVRNYGAGSGLGPDLTVNGIAQAQGDSLWIAALNDGLLLFDPAAGRFMPVPGSPRGHIWKVFKDTRGRLWISSATNGVTIYDPATGATHNVRHDPSNSQSLAGDHGRMVYEDPSGRIWIGAGNVIHRWDERSRSVTRYPNPARPQALFASPIGSDHQGRIWVDYLPAGLSVLDPSSGTYRNFDWSSGVSLNVNEMEALEDGRVLVTTDEGLHLFHPDSVASSRPPPPLVITRLSVNDAPFPRPQVAGGAPPIMLDHSQNVLEIEFAALDPEAAHLLSYSYRLEGLEEEWVKPAGRRFVRYTSLGPGSYLFRVRTASSEREWPEQEIAVPFAIAPPWWRTGWAYGLYSLLIVALATAALRLRDKQLRLKQQAAMEHFQAEHLAEVNQMKSRFLANISHEFRTPLTLILGPVEQALTANIDAPLREGLSLVRRNAHKLRGMIEQLLEFSRLEAGTVKLEVRSGDLRGYLGRVVQAFHSWAEPRGITLAMDFENVDGRGWFDADKLETVLNNLLSNALKFTPDGGRVEVTGESTEGMLRVAVEDTGPGIPAEHLPRIFDRFYRVDESHRTEGTGIGLALAKDLVEIHHGTISVRSRPGAGSTFTVTVPTARKAYSEGEIAAGDPPEAARPEQASPHHASGSPVRDRTEDDGDTQRPMVLVVEDNTDLRAYLRSILTRDFLVDEAEDGGRGLARARECMPDLVVTDVMMPVMDGFELCAAMKSDECTSHIPVILLTAKAESASRIEGLQTGADDYLTKPFEAPELLSRVRNLIALRRMLREKFARGVELKPGEVAVTSLDDAFLKRVMTAVEAKIAEEDFPVEDLAREVNLSRIQLYRKLRALTGLTPARFVRRMRLQRARELLEKNVGTVAEIADSVGFTNHSHFAHCFKEQFGMLPGELRSHH
jgi:signal transduction histidine kinase/ligand-binding sensor domain-containing protein/DNA-binding response OmpR family regulator